MGHDHLECGSGEFVEEELQFWDWMKAGEEFGRRETPRVRNTPNADREVPRGRDQGAFEHGGRSTVRYARGRSRFPNVYAGRGTQWKEEEATS